MPLEFLRSPPHNDAAAILDICGSGSACCSTAPSPDEKPGSQNAPLISQFSHHLAFRLLPALDNKPSPFGVLCATMPWLATTMARSLCAAGSISRPSPLSSD